MSDVVEFFRARLSEKLRAALAERNREAIRTLRCVMAALDNASAISHEEVARHTAASITEAPRRHLGTYEITEILRVEIDMRSKAIAEYERVGNAAQAGQLRDDIAIIEHMATLLP